MFLQAQFYRLNPTPLDQMTGVHVHKLIQKRTPQCALSLGSPLAGGMSRETHASSRPLVSHGTGMICKDSEQHEYPILGKVATHCTLHRTAPHHTANMVSLCDVLQCGVLGWCSAQNIFVFSCAVSTVRCGAVRCGAVRCGAVRCGAV